MVSVDGRPQIPLHNLPAAQTRPQIPLHNVVPTSGPQTFEGLMTSDRPLSDQTIESVVVGPLSLHRDEEAAIRQWASLAPASPEERQLIANPDRIGALHAQTAAMIATHGGLRVDRGQFRPEQAAYLEGLGRDQIAQLRADQGANLIRNVNLWRAGRGAEATLSDSLLYPNIPIDTNQGKVFLANRFGNSRFPGARSPISYQSGINDQYIHWTSNAIMDEWLQTGHQSDPARRIYMNPTISAQVGTFADLMQEFNKAGLAVAGKMTDRAMELAAKSVSREEHGDPQMRTDGIVLGISAADANAVLQITERYYVAHPEAFAGRPTPKLAQKVGEGVAISDEVPGSSLASSRSPVLTRVAGAVRQQLGLNPGDTAYALANPGRIAAAYRPLWEQAARAAGIDPNNLAWNL